MRYLLCRFTASPVFDVYETYTSKASALEGYKKGVQGVSSPWELALLEAGGSPRLRARFGHMVADRREGGLSLRPTVEGGRFCHFMDTEALWEEAEVEMEARMVAHRALLAAE